MMARYRRRTSEVTAVRFRPGLEDEWAHLWRDDVLVGRYRTKQAADDCPNKVSPGFYGDSVPVIVTPKGRVMVDEDDWIVTNEHGERTVVKSSAFETPSEYELIPANRTIEGS